MNIGDRIRKARKAAKMTQAQLAERSGVAAITIHQYESGKRQPRTEQLTAIARALDVSLESLISEKTVVMPGLEVKKTDHPVFDEYVYNIEADTSEKLAFMLERIKEQGVFQHLLLQEFQKLNAVGQAAAVQLIQQLAQKPEFNQSEEVLTNGVNTDADDKGRA